ncbi:hypothetical protein BH11MYX3_BH11MYX3_22180 [soil metagenome]
MAAGWRGAVGRCKHLNVQGCQLARRVLHPCAMRLAIATALVVLFGACAAEPTIPAGDDVGPDDEEPDIADPADELPMPDRPGQVQLIAGCTAQATIGGHPAWLFFTRPDRPCTGTAGSGLDAHALVELTRLISSVPAGGRIDGHIFSITVDGVAKALLDAQTRGVDVRISADGAVATSTDTAKTQYLDQLTRKVYCVSANNTACISTTDGAISHTKLFVFSTATAPDGAVSDNVVWFGSANQTYASGERLYNNTVTLYGDTVLFGKLRAYLDDLYSRRRTADYYDSASGRGYLLADSADVYVSPEVETDLVINRLNDVTPDATCEVRVIQASVRDSRIDVVNLLVTMKRGGCKVSVVADTVEPAALAALKGASIVVRHMPIHDKSFIIHGNYGGTPTFRVYSGSHNLSGGSAHRFDEIFVKLAPETGATHPLYDAYVAHFTDAFSAGTPL